jgi:hypothetical protein
MACPLLMEAVFLAKVKTMVRNYIWENNPMGNTRVKVGWNSAILPNALGGVKIFDPFAQASALLTKMIPRGLEPGREPWKVLLQHRV